VEGEEAGGGRLREEGEAEGLDHKIKGQGRGGSREGSLLIPNGGKPEGNQRGSRGMEGRMEGRTRERGERPEEDNIGAQLLFGKERRRYGKRRLREEEGRGREEREGGGRIGRGRREGERREGLWKGRVWRRGGRRRERWGGGVGRRTKGGRTPSRIW
jgi:hypothetical protein